MEKDGLTELALLFRERDPKTSPSITTGIVVAPPPDPRIQLNEVIILEKENLVFAAHLVDGYERHIQLSDTDAGTTTTESDGGEGASAHTHGIAELNVDTTMKWLDTVKAGDEVILIPVEDGQLYYVIDKAVKF